MKFKMNMLAALLAAVGFNTATRATTRDTAYTFRMGTGYPGDISRAEFARVVPGLVDATTPPRLAGDAVLVNTSANTYRGFVVGDTTTPVTVDGVAVRSFPTQQTSGGMSSALGASVLPTSGVMDVLREGFIMVKVNGAVTKKGPAYVWIAATAGNNIQGGFVATLTGGSSVLVSNARFTGPAGPDGVAELEVWAL